MKGKSLSHVRLFATPWTTAYQAPPPMRFSRQEYWSGVPLPSSDLKLIEIFSEGLEIWIKSQAHNGQIRSVAQLCPTLCNPTDCSTLASLSFTISQSLLKLMSIELVMPFNHLILCRPLLVLPSIFPSNRFFSHESALCIRRPKNLASAPVLPMNIRD